MARNNNRRHRMLAAVKQQLADNDIEYTPSKKSGSILMMIHLSRVRVLATKINEIMLIKSRDGLHGQRGRNYNNNGTIEVQTVMVAIGPPWNQGH